MKIGLTYWSSTGNTEQMAEMMKEALEAKGHEVVYSDISSLDKDAFFACDALVLGGPAQGTEEVCPDQQELLDNDGDKMSGKKVAIFGSYGWGGGEYMNGWVEQVKGKGATVVGTVTCEEAPDDSVKAELEDLAGKL